MMDETIREDGFEAKFVVRTPRAEAWQRLCDAKPAFEFFGEARDGQWWVPGIEAPADELEVEPESLLRARKAVEPCKGTEIVITLEDAETGTRIHIVQTGFGDGFAEGRPWLTAGWHAILADLVVFFERGVSLGRHGTWWYPIGCDVIETDEGLAVANVMPGGFAAEAGMLRGDLILQIAGAPVVNVRDLSILTRGPLSTGTEWTARYLRNREVLTGTGTI
jgi:hypothetical protein